MDPTTQRLIASSGGETFDDIVFVTGATGTLTAFKWTNTAGWGGQYSDPSVLLTGTVSSLAPSLSRRALLIGTSVTPFIHAYEWNDATGFGAKYSDPAALTGTAGTVARHPTVDQFCATVNATNDAVYEIDWDDTTGFGTISVGIGTDTNAYSAVSFHPNGNFIIVTKQLATTNILIHAYSISTGIGAQTASSNAPDLAYDGCFNESGNLIAVSHRDNPGITAATWNGASIGTLRSPTGPAVTTAPNIGCIFSPGACIWGYAISPFMYAAPINTSTAVFGTLFSDPATLPINDANNFAFNETYDVLFCSALNNTASALIAYEWDDSTGFGTKYADPVLSTAFAGTLQSVYALYGKNPRNGYA